MIPLELLSDCNGDNPSEDPAPPSKRVRASWHVQNGRCQESYGRLGFIHVAAPVGRKPVNDAVLAI